MGGRKKGQRLRCLPTATRHETVKCQALRRATLQHICTMSLLQRRRTRLEVPEWSCLQPALALQRLHRRWGLMSVRLARVSLVFSPDPFPHKTDILLCRLRWLSNMLRRWSSLCWLLWDMELLGTELSSLATNTDTFAPCPSCRMHICEVEKLDRLLLSAPFVCPPFEWLNGAVPCPSHYTPV